MSSGGSKPVLVLDGDQPSALAIVRSLGRRGIVTDVAGPHAGHLAGRSRHARASLHYPDSMRDDAAFAAWLLQRAGAYALVIPVTERTVVPLLRVRHRFAPQLLALAPTDALEQVLDKDRTVALAQRLGIPVPRSVTVQSVDQAKTAATEFDFPVVVKPGRSVGSGTGRRVHLSVSYARTLRDVELQCGAALGHGPVILQEYFAGDGVGVELIADRGEIRFAFQHRRLHEVPLTGGGSSLRVSEAVSPPLLQACHKLMAALGWHGVAMVEFKVNPAQGDFRLMEINGRFWGSLPLAVAAGADFPVMLNELMVDGQIQPRPAARIGILGRSLSRDLDWLEHVLRRAAPPDIVRLPRGAEVLRDSALVFSPRHRFDVQSLGDPWPGLVDLWAIAARQLGRVTAAWRGRRELSAALRNSRVARAREAGLRSRRVLFLCYGNINRSALAQAYAQARHGEGRTFASAGFHCVEGRPADPVMVRTASALGIDLDGWASRRVTAAMVEEADVVMVMEPAHQARLFDEVPAARHKTVLLGGSTAATPAGVVIRDPYGLAPEVYESVCLQVVEAVDGWFSQQGIAPATRATASAAGGA